MKAAELFEGWFDKKEEPKNEPLTAAERKMIASAFKGHNADIKKPGTDEPLFPENIHVVTDTKHITFYKRKGQLKATVGHYASGKAGDPKERPIIHTDHDINSAEDLKSLQEAVAGPFKKFKKGQIVTVKKTGKKVEVLGQNDIGLVQTVSTDKADLKIKNWRDYSAATLKRGLVSGAGHQEYMPSELEEGWKMGAAAVALSGAVVAGIANSPKVEINGETYDKAASIRSAPDRAKSAVVQINGKDTKVLYWDAIGHKGHKSKVYKIDEASAPREDIPPYAVCHTSDGVVRKDDVHMGSKDDCIEYIRKHKAPKGMNFDIMHIDSGKLVSYKL